MTTADFKGSAFCLPHQANSQSINHAPLTESVEITVKADTVSASSSATDSGRNGGASVFHQKSQTAGRQAQQKQELDKRVSGQKEGDYSGCGAAASGAARLLHLAVSLLPSDATPPRPAPV